MPSSSVYPISAHIYDIDKHVTYQILLTVEKFIYYASSEHRNSHADPC